MLTSDSDTATGIWLQQKVGVPMYTSPITNGPGPTHPLTDFNQARLVRVPHHSYVEIQATFNTTWVSYIYIYDTGTRNVIYELTNDTNNADRWNSPENVSDNDIVYGVLNYHKINVSPGGESPSDEFIQGSLALNTEEKQGNSLLIRAGFSDGHGRPDNALATIIVSLAQ
jgi:hypothetical protein